MKKYNRIFTIVIDSLGIGAMDDSKQYGDIDVDTLGHIAEAVESLNIPNLQKMGIANLHKTCGKYRKSTWISNEIKRSKCW